MMTTTRNASAVRKPTPDELKKTGWLQVVGRRVVVPNFPTCGDRIIDFFVIGERLAHVAPKAYTIGDGTFYPHRPTRLLMGRKRGALLSDSYKFRRALERSFHSALRQNLRMTN